MKTRVHTHLSTSFLQTIKGLFKLFIILNVSLLLSSCFLSLNKAPTADRSRPVTTKVDTHIVKSGETLYSIAWRYGLDYKAFARANGIGNDFLIYPGQTLKVSVNTTNTKAAKVNKKVPKSVARSSASTSRAPKRTTSSTHVSRSSHKTSTASTQSRSRSEKKSSQSKAVAKSKLSSSGIRWRWPYSGQVITNFSTKKGGSKGIDIKGKKGDSVVAAASGRIVYAGSGLRGYGKLVIIKHNDTYLSAYAHNDRIRVKEGDFVKAGQRIADIGSSGSRTDTVKLHFEIRRNGQPVNPVRLLPKRKT